LFIKSPNKASHSDGYNRKYDEQHNDARYVIDLDWIEILSVGQTDDILLVVDRNVCILEEGSS
jgi:hypothetical protein